MAIRRGFTPWMGAGKSWPAGTVAGDTAVMVRMGTRTRRGLGAWQPAGHYTWSSGGDARWATWLVDVWARVLTAADLSKPPPSDYGQVTVLSQTGGIGVVRTGVGHATARPGGGVLSVSWTADAAGSDLGAGPSWQSPAGAVSQPSVWGPVSARTMVGWSDAPSGGSVGAGRRGASLAVELLPPEGPGAPSVLSPSDGQEVPTSGAVSFAWQHRPSHAGGFQDAYRLRVDAGAGWRWWSASSGAFSSSETTNSSAVQELELDATEFTAFVGHVWQVSTREGLDGAWSPYSPAASFVPVTAPSLVLTSPTAVHNDLTPTITWTASTPRGQQTARRVQLVDALSSLVVYDSQWRPGPEQEWTVPPQFRDNPAHLKQRVRIQQTGGSESAWAEEPLTISWDEPDPPVVTAAPAVGGGVLVTVEVATPMSVTLERVGTDGLWSPVVAPSDAAPGAPLEVVDVFAQAGVPTAYRAQGVVDLDGQWLRSAWAVTDPLTSTDRRGTYLALAANPTATWVKVFVTALGTVQRAESVSTTYGLGDDYGRVTYGEDQGETGEVTVWVGSQADYDTVLRLLQAQEPLLLRLAPEVDSYTGDWDGGRVLTLARSSQVSVERAGVAAIQSRRISFSWVEQPPAILDGSAQMPTRDPAITLVGDVVVFG